AGHTRTATPSGQPGSSAAAPSTSSSAVTPSPGVVAPSPQASSASAGTPAAGTTGTTGTTPNVGLTPTAHTGLTRSADGTGATPWASPGDFRATPLLVPTSPGPALEDWDERGRWLAHCESHEGTSRLRLSWPHAPRGSEDIEQLLARSPHGDWLVARVGGRVWLLDVRTGLRIDLSALDVELDADTLPSHRSLAFSDDEKVLALLVRGSKQARLLDLERLRSEPDANPAALARLIGWEGAAWRLEFAGTQLVVRLAGPSTRNQGWPVPPSKSPPRRCDRRSRFDAFGALSEPNASYTSAVLLLPSGADRPEPAPGFVFALRGGWVRREADGRLVLVQGRVQKQLATARCGARVLYTDAERQRFVIACEQYRPTPAPEASGKGRATQRAGAHAPRPPTRFPLYLVSPGGVTDLGLDTARTGMDVPPSASPRRFFPWRTATESVLIDLEQRRAISLGADVLVLAVDRERALLKRGSRLTVHDGQSEKPSPLGWTALAPLWSEGDYVAHGAHHGRLPAPSCQLGERQTALALAPTGALLTFEPNGSSGTLRLLPPCGAELAQSPATSASQSKPSAESSVSSQTITPP
ncbi:MAG TPA: hypothetical protein VLC09_08445, partial [Polyangiaceae bacterium]|nr:hypothetical protein [Polyangiaceae bacterium]